MTEKLSVEEFLAIRKSEALKIDPETAEVICTYEQLFDPYGIHPDLPEELKSSGRVSWARAPGSDIWVCFDDLPEETYRALWERSETEVCRRTRASFEQFYIFVKYLSVSEFKRAYDALLAADLRLSKAMIEQALARQKQGWTEEDRAALNTRRP